VETSFLASQPSFKMASSQSPTLSPPPPNSPRTLAPWPGNTRFQRSRREQRNPGFLHHLIQEPLMERLGEEPMSEEPMSEGLMSEETMSEEGTTVRSL